MTAERLTMRKIREIARLHFSLAQSGRAIARACNVSPATVQDYLGRLRVAQLGWPLPPDLDSDAALERALFRDTAAAVRTRPLPDWALVCTELRRKHVTKALLWQEYREQQPNGVGYSQFCEYYARWLQGVTVVMRQEHRAGERMFVDFSGDGMEIITPTGEVILAKLFVAVLGASNLTYVEAVVHEDLDTWVGCHVRALAYFGGVPEFVVPDNLRSGVSKVHRYEPEVNRTYSDLAQHYGFAVIPARPRKPRDKAKVEQGVLLAERWIIAALRNHRFSDLFDVNDAIGPLVHVAQRAPDAQDRPLTPSGVREHRESHAQAAAGLGVRPRDLRESDDQHRLPRRVREALLQRPAQAPRPDRAAGRAARDLDDSRGLPSRRAGREPSAKPCRAQVHHVG